MNKEKQEGFFPAILISIVSIDYYGMLKGQIHINLHPENPIISFQTVEIKMAAVSAKRFN